MWVSLSTGVWSGVTQTRRRVSIVLVSVTVVIGVSKVWKSGGWGGSQVDQCLAQGGGVSSVHLRRRRTPILLGVKYICVSERLVQIWESDGPVGVE